MVPDVGFELTTDRLQGGCSTTELIRHQVLTETAFVAQQAGEPAPPPLADRLSQATRLVGVHKALDVPVVLWVDRLAGLHGPAQFERCEPPPPDAPPWQGQRLIDRQQRPWQEINLMGLCAMPAFLSVAA